MARIKKLVIKIGTGVITRDNGQLDVAQLSQIVDQVAKLKKQNIEVILVSSGAMGAGRSLIELQKKTNDMVKRQVLSAVGQVELIKTYQKLFAKYGVLTAQVLASKEDFRDRQHFLNMKNCFQGLLAHGIVPIVNENDVVSVTELMFTDNDELAGLVATMMAVDTLVLLSTVEGVLDEQDKVISRFSAKDTSWQEVVSAQKSTFGRGGMATKCRIAQKLSTIGISTHIIKGQAKDNIVKLIQGQTLGTTFVAAKRNLSAVKKWIAYSDGYEKGVVQLNDCAEPVLRDERAAHSLLPVGITKLGGYFEKGDIIKIKNHQGKAIGFGRAEYGSDLAKSYIGQKGKKPLVHYDYLYLN